ncbi:MAG: glycosyltransferase [Lachnospiraceae bacterium]|nr:glycosyltransferase [Lachnospiraceae bacterium]
MKLLTIDIGSYIQPDVLLKLTEMGIEHHDLVHIFDRSNMEAKYRDDPLEELLDRELRTPYDAVFTTNFYPVIARVCHRKGIRYIAWSYDSPMNLPRTDELEHPTNFLFVFDRAEWKKYRDLGLDSVYHLPLAVNCDRLDLYRPQPGQFDTDVSLVGNLYESTLPVLKGSMTPYQSGYIDAVVQAQMQVYGLWFAEQALPQELLDGINAHYKELSSTAMQISRAQLAFSVAQHITHVERIALLRLMKQAGMQVDLYTMPLSEQEEQLLQGIRVHPPISYGENMPLLFKSSRINLNPTLKAIGSGIPLRALDIVGCGGFLLTSWQPEIAEHFIDGEEVVMYTDIADAVEKAVFYMKHEDLRRKIAENGYQRARSDFRYEDRLREIFRIAGCL